MDILFITTQEKDPFELLWIIFWRGILTKTAYVQTVFQEDSKTLIAKG